MDGQTRNRTFCCKAFKPLKHALLVDWSGPWGRENNLAQTKKGGVRSKQPDQTLSGFLGRQTVCFENCGGINANIAVVFLRPQIFFRLL